MSDAAHRMTKKEQVLQLLKSQEWSTTMEINAVGGSEGTRRLREIRQIFPCEKRKAAIGTQYEYRLLTKEEIDVNGDLLYLRELGSY